MVKNKIAISLSMTVLCAILLELSFPSVVGVLGISSVLATTICDVISAYGTATFVISIIAGLLGAGPTIATLVGLIFQYIKQKGKKYAVYW